MKSLSQEPGDMIRDERVFFCGGGWGGGVRSLRLLPGQSGGLSMYTCLIPILHVLKP